MSQLRKQFNGRFEHRESERPGSPVWLFAPLWLQLHYWSIWQKSEKASVATDGVMTSAQKKEHYQALAEEAKYLQLISKLIPAEHVERVFSVIASEFSKAIAVTDREHPPAAERFVVALDSAREKIATEFNVNINGHATTADRAASGKPNRAKQAKAGKVAKAVR